MKERRQCCVYWNWRFGLGANAFRVSFFPCIEEKGKKSICLKQVIFFNSNWNTVVIEHRTHKTQQHRWIGVFSHILIYRSVTQFRSSDTFYGLESKLFQIIEFLVSLTPFPLTTLHILFVFYYIICDKSMIEIFKAPK